MENTEVEFKGVNFEIEFYYQPYEPPETGINAQYPGCGEEIEIIKIKHNGVCFYEIMESYFSEIVEEIFKSRE